MLWWHTLISQNFGTRKINRNAAFRKIGDSTAKRKSDVEGIAENIH